MGQMSFSDFECTDKRKQARRDGSGCALGLAAEADQAVLPKGGRRQKALPSGNHATYSSVTELVLAD